MKEIKKLFLIFESEFKNGEINGKGKEYNDIGELIFKGEYLYGKRSKGKEYKNNIIIFDGNYLNGEKSKGKEYNYLEDLIFEGEFKNNKRWKGKGKEYLEGGLVFEGEYLYGERNGKGKEYKIMNNKNLSITINGEIKNFDNNKNLIFIGKYLNGKKWNGNGYDYFYDQYLNKIIIFEREYIKGKKSESEIHFDKNGKIILEIYYSLENKIGKGKEYDSKGNIIFEGEYQNAKRNGKGIAFNNNKKVIFKGQYINDKLWNGIEYTHLGRSILEQEYKNGEKSERIILKEYFKNKLIFEGEYLNGKKNGKGKEYFKEKLIFDGNYLNGKRNGFGIEYNFEGGYFKGEFKSGNKWDGTGYDKNKKIEYEIINGCANEIIKEYYNGILVYIGEYSNGNRHGDGKEYDFLTRKLKYEGKFIYGKKIK